ncbi:hypothetical protein F652_2014 [Enterobacteriaceae bacterium bta3-1]|nr:hypothetical protein F652_2014 [Enterobacteriaceae bacterium bta3-1]
MCSQPNIGKCDEQLLVDLQPIMGAPVSSAIMTDKGTYTADDEMRP